MTVRFGFSLQGRGVLAEREAITTLAKLAEALGYDSIWVTDRLLIPVQSRSAYPYSPTGAFPLGPDEPWLEPLTALTYLATITERINVGTNRAEGSTEARGHCRLSAYTPQRITSPSRRGSERVRGRRRDTLRPGLRGADGYGNAPCPRAVRWGRPPAGTRLARPPAEGGED